MVSGAVARHVRSSTTEHRDAMGRDGPTRVSVSPAADMVTGRVELNWTKLMGLVMHTTRTLAWSLACSLLLGVIGVAGQNPTVAPAGLPCDRVGEIQFICDLISPEDLAVVPGSEWVIASGNRAGGRIQLINVEEKTATALFPGPAQNGRLDADTYPSCPGPIDPSEGDAFNAHGLYLEPGQGEVHVLYVVHHGHRESIEVFELDAKSTPTIAWIGCAVAPEAVGFNGVVALPGGGFAATSPRTGDVWEWHTHSGWMQVPGSEDTAPNGLEISADGRWFYIAGWAEEKLTRLSRGQTPIQKEVVDLGFRPDNLRMSLDGSVIFAAGHGNIQTPRAPLQETSNVATIDPESLAVERVFQHPALDGFVASTTAIQIGNEMWLGTHRGERVAYLPVP